MSDPTAAAPFTEAEVTELLREWVRFPRTLGSEATERLLLTVSRWQRLARRIVEWGPTTGSDRQMHADWLRDALDAGIFPPEDSDDDA